jgi:hypothetical protein
VHDIYFVGGFGDEHYIGYIDSKLYHEVEPDESTYVNHNCNDEIEQVRWMNMQHP